MKPVRTLPLALLCLAAACGDEGGARPVDPSSGPTGPGSNANGGQNNNNDANPAVIAFLSVPVDESNPDGESVDLRYVVVGDPTVQPVLLTHFGGPGNSAVEILDAFLAVIPEPIATALTENFALVALEEIGVGESAPLDCGDTGLTDYSENALILAGEALAAECRDGYPLFDQLGTLRFARDIERLRLALGTPELNVLAYSYGTQVALSYAVLFPETTGRLVLDSPLDPRVSLTERSVLQSEGFSAALQAFFDFCDFGVDCSFGDGNAEAAFDLLYARFSAPSQLSDLIALEGTVSQALYYEPNWPDLGIFLRNAQQSTTLPRGEPNSAPGPFFGTTCTDFPVGSIEEIRAAEVELNQNEAVFRRTLYSSLFPCLSWGTPGEPVDWETLLPAVDDVLLAGATGDPVTPVAFMDSLETTMSNAVRVNTDAFSHAIGLFGDEPCYDDAILDFLLTGAPPSGGC